MQKAKKRDADKASAIEVDKKKQKTIRAAWLFRLMATTVDLAFIIMFANGLHRLGISMLMAAPIVLMPYYLIFEYYLSRTPGKILMGMRFERFEDKSQRFNKTLWRTILRLCFLFMLFFVGPIGMLSWRRITLLDFLTNTRVLGIHPTKIESRFGKKRTSPIVVEGWR